MNDAHANIWKCLGEYNCDWPHRGCETAVPMRRVGCGRCTKKTEALALQVSRVRYILMVEEY